jgi:glycosyltransferase involved in cell wall biosynthesis
VDLIVRALALTDPALRLIVAGEGTQRDHVEREAHAAGVADRVTFLGSVEDDALVELYAGTLAVIYPPYDEDFGYVTLEAFLARKPVVTCTDSGGPNEFVVDGTSGYVCEPDPEALAQAMRRLSTDRRRAAAFGDAGHEVARRITWDGVVETLVG